MKFFISSVFAVLLLCIPVARANAGGIPPTAPPPPVVTPKHIPTLPPSPPPTSAPPTMPSPPPVIKQPLAPISQQNVQHNVTTNSPNTTNNACGINQNGNNNSANCQIQTQQQNINQTIAVNVTATPTITPTPTTIAAAPPPPANAQQQVMQATVAPPSVPTQLPNTGAGANILAGLGTLIPLGIKMRKLLFS